MFKNQFFQSLIWNVHQEGGKRKDRCVGNGSVKDLEKKNIKESYEEPEVNKNKIFLKIKLTSSQL